MGKYEQLEKKRRGSTFKSARLRTGLTQAECAKKLGYSSGNDIYRKENGTRITRDSDFMGLAYACKAQLRLIDDKWHYKNEKGKWVR